LETIRFIKQKGLILRQRTLLIIFFYCNKKRLPYPGSLFLCFQINFKRLFLDMTVVTLGRCTFVFHLFVTILAESVSDIFPRAEFLIFEVCVVAFVTRLDFIKCFISAGKPGSSVILIMMADSTVVLLLMLSMWEIDRLFAVGIQGHFCCPFIGIC